MNHLDDIPTLWDEWQKLRHLFQSNDDDRFFEVAFEDLESDKLYLCLQELLNQCTSLSSFFVLAESRVPVRIPSLMHAMIGVSTDNMVGAMGITLPNMPMLTFYFDEPRRISLAYAPGHHWSPLAVTSFLLLLHDLSHTLESSDIRLSSSAFTRAQMKAFTQTLAYYV